MATTRRIFLGGPMGAGKSTIGRRLARTLRLRFLDSDHEIQRQTGVDIPLIFELEGESGFRKRESAMLEQLTTQDGIVLATGGGAVLDEENRRVLRERGTVVYLETPVDEQLRRTRRDRNRPLLQTENPRERLQNLLAEREPLYRDVADLTVSTAEGSIPAILDAILIGLQTLETTDDSNA
ncbi:MAG: shikimate kinase AroK [Ectothiorhodospiraceae bacterium]|nr:shikimate kinase AroK [Ectothiorhodospiraceae bacterium]